MGSLVHHSLSFVCTNPFIAHSVRWVCRLKFATLQMMVVPQSMTGTCDSVKNAHLCNQGACTALPNLKQYRHESSTHIY